MVLEIPPASEGADAASLTGSIDDAWPEALEDVGPAGADRGKGGKYLILPPGYTEEIPDGYIPLPSQTYAGFALLRSNVRSGSDADVAKAVSYGKRIRFYPLSQAAKPPPTVFIDAVDTVFDSTIPYDLRFFETLDRVVQREPWLERDKVMIDQLKTIGIEKGKPFNPDANTQTILTAAAREAHDWLDLTYQGNFTPPFNEGTRWALPAAANVLEGMGTHFAKPELLPHRRTRRRLFDGVFQPQALGRGPVLSDDYRGQGRYAFRRRQHVSLERPSNPPVTLYWSATAYDRATHALIRDQKSSEPLVAKSGPAKERRRLGGHLFRTEGPAGKGVELGADERPREIRSAVPPLRSRETLFDKTWKLPDIERIAAQ